MGGGWHSVGEGGTHWGSVVVSGGGWHTVGEGGRQVAEPTVEEGITHFAPV